MSRSRRALITVATAVAVAILITVAIAVWRIKHGDTSGYQNYSSQIEIKVNGSIVMLHISRQDDIVLKGTFGDRTNSNSVTKTSCTVRDHDDEAFCYQWSHGDKVEIHRIISNDLQCYSVQWTVADGVEETPTNCFDLEGVHWYGGFEEAYQLWPINSYMLHTSPFSTGDAWRHGDYGDVIEGLFISSQAAGIFLHEPSTLYMSINGSGKGFCFAGKSGEDTFYFHTKQPRLWYDICVSSDIKSLWTSMSSIYLDRPMGHPSADVFRNPIWSTWAMFKAAINQSTVLEFATEISKQKFPISQLEIDDNWTSKYGDMTFDPEKFPNVRAMITQLTAKGIPVTVWIHPFFNTDSLAFQELSRSGFLLKKLNSEEPAVTTWWRGLKAGVLDLTNPNAVEWYLQKLKNLKEQFNVTSFKFDAGELNWLPKTYRSKQNYSNPNMYTTKYVQLAYDSDPIHRRQEVRVGFKSQRYPVFVRILDRESDWTHKRGLRTLIPCALTFGLMGYPFVLPDMIGGNAYDPDNIDTTVYPEPELFVRWLQATTFMPVLQFSVAPWIYNDTVVQISRKYIQLHERFSGEILRLAKSAAQTGEPILRPLWWTDPCDDHALILDDQFLLGNDILVAPILDKGSRSRDVYLPSGQWKDELRGVIYGGKQWLNEYSVALDELPYFTRM